MRSGSPFRSALAWVVAACAASLIAACDKAPLLAPTNSTLTITVPTTILPLGGSTEVTAFVTESAGTPVQNGTLVHFSTTSGSLSPIDAQTRNGFATTTFSAGNTSGTATITARSGTATASTATPIQIGAVAATAISVTATPSTVPGTGGTVTISAIVRDVAGNRVVGVPVSFSTSAGTLSSTTATTDANGEASVQLTTNRTATVTVSSGNITAAPVTVNLSTPATIALAVAPANPIAGSPVTLTVTPTIATGAPPPRVVIDWGDGSTQDLGVVTGARSVTHTYSNAGAFTITATATSDGETTSNSIVVIVGQRPAPTLTATPNPATTAQTVTITVTPATTGLPVRNVTLDFGDGSSMDLGAITGATTVTRRYTSSGTFTLRATQTDVNGGTSTAVVVQTITPAP
jgi:hypothetical protein